MTLPPEAMQQVLREAIDNVIDVEVFNHELEEEKKDARFLAEVRERTIRALVDLI